MSWKKIGVILKTNAHIPWLHTWASAACPTAETVSDANIRLYITGREKNGASRIGTAILHLDTLTISDLSSFPLFPLGKPGMFDQHGTSYPSVIKVGSAYRLYYTGWMRGETIPWYNALGMATAKDGVHFKKVSDAPIFDRNPSDPIGIGSSCIRRYKNQWIMWYTSFSSWKPVGKALKHYYHIKYATAKDGIHWNPTGHICIDFENAKEHAIATPSVLFIHGLYLMWYSYRGSRYRIGFAVSKDGVHWKRRDNDVGLSPSLRGWDSDMVCYPSVFMYKNLIYMLYNGNGYGASGLGVATMTVDDLMSSV